MVPVHRHISLAMLAVAVAAAPLAAQSTVHSADGRATLTVHTGPTAALSLLPVRVVAVEDLTDPAAVHGSRYRIEPDSAAFAWGATLAIRFVSSDVPGGVAPSALAIAALRGTRWMPLTSVVSAGAVTATVRRGGEVAVRWRAPSAPCTAPPYHALDFRIGEWDYRAPGFDPGHTVVERDTSGCALTERYGDNTGGRAFAFFVYDVRDNGWHSTTYDPGGRSTASGRPEGGRMVFYHSTTDREAYELRSDSTVTLTGERSTDGGITWTAWFHATYTRAMKTRR